MTDKSTLYGVFEHQGSADWYQWRDAIGARAYRRERDAQAQADELNALPSAFRETFSGFVVRPSSHVKADGVSIDTRGKIRSTGVSS